MAIQMSVYQQELEHEMREIPKEYWPNLLQIVRLFRESVTLKPATTSFRQGWQETVSGQTLPVSELWEGIDS